MKKILNLALPALILGALTGTVTSVIVNLYKLLAGYVVGISEKSYHWFIETPVFLLAAVAVIILLSFAVAFIHRKLPEVKGGGIPVSIAAMRGFCKLKSIAGTIGVFCLSLVSFSVGIPLGTEGPSVQMGCSVGVGISKLFCSRNRTWEGYSMTGGACAGFAVATGAPVSGIVFAIEEAHRKISPRILVSAASAVLFSGMTTEWLAPVLGVSKALFPALDLPALDLGNMWIPLTVGVISGAFGVIFLKGFKLLDRLFNKKLKTVPAWLKIFAVTLLTLICGTRSVNCVSTGHELALHMLCESMPVLTLVILLFIRSLLTLSANANGITGGTFLPFLAVGAVLGGIVAKLCTWLGADSAYYTLIIVFALVGCVSAMMKMPLTAVIFAIEALYCYENIICVILVALVSYMITEAFGVKSMADIAVERIEEKEAVVSEECTVAL